MIRREIESAIRRDFGLYKVIGITGPRQSGKTTLMRAMFPTTTYTSLEDLSEREFAATDPKGFLLQAKGGLLIDEIHRVPSLLSYIQAIADTRETPGQFVISGSQNLLLMEQISQTLAGRISLFTLLPLSLSELSRDGRQLPVLAELLFRGLYPALYDRPFDPQTLATHYLRGGIFENFVTAELRKAFFNKGMVPSLHFWRDRRGHEVDLLIEGQSGRIAVEVKSGITAARSFFDGLDYYRSLDKELTVADSYVLYGGDENQDRSYGKLRGWRALADPSSFGI